MKLFLTSIFILMSSSAYSNPLIGTWKSDEVRTLIEVKKIKNLPQKVRKLFENNFFGKLTFTFTKKEMFSEFDGEKYESTYEVIKQSEHSITIKFWSDELNEYFEETYYIDGDSIYAITSKYQFREYFMRLK